MTHWFIRFVIVFAGMWATGSAQAGAPFGYLSWPGICKVANPAGFQPAQAIEALKPSYPYKALNDWGEGWVLAEFAVTADGNVRDIAVVDAVGAKEFVTSSLAAISAQRFRPALRNGAPVDQHWRSTSVTYVFTDTAAVPTHPEFYERYEMARNRIQSNRLDDAIDQLKLMQQVWRLNLYETAMSSYLLAVAYAKKEDWENARYHIEHAFSEDGDYLNKALKPDAIELLVKLRAQATDLGGAFCGLNRVDAQGRAALAPLEAEIRARLLSDAPLVSDGKLIKHPLTDQPGTWRRQLLRRKFSFANVSGEAKSFRLACIAASFEHAIDPEMQWTVPEQAGSCVIRVSGAPGATFKFIEEW